MFNRKGKVTMFRFGPVEITKIGFRRWGIRVWDLRAKGWVDQGVIDNKSESAAKAWARQQSRKTEFLWKLQQALNRGQIDPDDYYRILAREQQKWDGCQKPHVHSMKCQYHDHH